MPLYIQP